MDDQTLIALIGAGSGLAGAVIGVAGASFAAARQHDRTLSAERETEARQRARDAAMVCDHALEELARDLPMSASSTTHDEARSLREMHNRAAVERAVVDLPEPWRGRVQQALHYLEWSDDMANYGFHYSSYWSICRSTWREIHEVLSAFLRNQAEPPAVSALWIEHGIALHEVFEMKANEHGEDDEDYKRRRREWRQKRSLPENG